MSNSQTALSSSPITVSAIGLSSANSIPVLDAVEVSGYGFRQYPTLDSLLEGMAPSAMGCVLISTGDDAAIDRLVVSRLASHFFSMPVVALLESNSAAHAVELMKAGVFSVQTTPLEHTDLLTAIKQAIALSVHSQTAIDESRDASIRMHDATAKEIEVLDLIVNGKKNKQIASLLGITVRAVEDRRFRLMKKVKVDSVAELVATAIKARQFDQGVINPNIRSASPDNPQQCVKGIEVWAPSATGSELTLAQGCYRDAAAFKDASRDMTFRKGEGLPGNIWQQRSPAFLKELITNDFVRRSVAGEAGVTTAVGFPVFKQGEIQSIVLLLLDSRHHMKAAFEWWKYDSAARALRLAGGTFVNCESLRRLSEFVSLPMGEGLPGVTSEKARPWTGARFFENGQAVRGVAFSAEQLVSAVALPLTDSGSDPSDVFILLNSQATPIFTLLQQWKPTPDGRDIVLSAEYIDGIPSLASVLSPISQAIDTGIAGRAWQTGQPTVVGNGAAANSIICSSSVYTPTIGLAVPTLVDGKVVAVTVLAN